MNANKSNLMTLGGFGVAIAFGAAFGLATLNVTPALQSNGAEHASTR